KKVDGTFLKAQHFDEIVIATGVLPREINLEGIDHPKVLSYIDVLKNNKIAGSKVAIIGAGGIGFDVAEYLAHEGGSPGLDTNDFLREWGVDRQYTNRGALAKPQPLPAAREIYLLQRSKTKPGKNLGKTTGWIHRASLKMKKVKMINGVVYQKIDYLGLHFIKNEKRELLEADNV